MKKFFTIFIILIFLGTMSATALPISLNKIERTPIPIKTGTFDGEIYIESEPLGVISGIYTTLTLIKDGFTITRFKGQWEITAGEYAGSAGTVVGIGGKFFQIGRIIIDGTGEKFSIICQISFNEINNRYSGDLKLILGPTLYTSGDFQEN